MTRKEVAGNGLRAERQTMATQVRKLKSDETEGRGSPLEMLGFFGRLAEHPRRWRGFLHEVRVEMRQVTWPTRHEVFVTTWVVIVTVAFFGVFFFGVDSGVSWLVQRIIKLFAH
jgi:preprotein translocase subunit SecE